MTQEYLGAIIIPALNEENHIEASLLCLQPLRSHWLLILVDGGSKDTTTTIAKHYVDELLVTVAGRAEQQNEGALIARQRLGVKGILVFLHADTRLPDTFSEVMTAFQRVGRDWGRFDVRLSGTDNRLRLVEFLINFRSRHTSIATGDQVLFFRARMFWQLGGFPMLALMEDIEISKLAKRLSPPFCPRDRVVTSSRKWERQGVWKTILLMWVCRAAYFFGVQASTIHRWYYGTR